MMGAVMTVDLLTLVLMNRRMIAENAVIRCGVCAIYTEDMKSEVYFYLSHF